MAVPQLDGRWELLEPVGTPNAAIKDSGGYVKRSICAVVFWSMKIRGDEMVV